MATVSAFMNLQPKSESGADLLRDAMRRLVTGVTVVTLPVGEGMTGFTASSFTSVSLDPPLVLVCVSNQSRSYQHIKSAPGIAIHILEHDQSEIASGFARPGIDRSTVCDWTRSPRGNPILGSFLSVLECEIHDIREAGDHSIVIARVIEIQTKRDDARPLVYHKGKMFAMPCT
jgi:3-hydroxy-9,10-secoandrosta-1,3,5(10)-triene-9,17-dione monooxygenase reductase component